MKKRRIHKKVNISEGLKFGSQNLFSLLSSRFVRIILSFFVSSGPVKARVRNSEEKRTRQTHQNKRKRSPGRHSRGFNGQDIQKHSVRNTNPRSPAQGIFVAGTSLLIFKGNYYPQSVAVNIGEATSTYI